MVLAGIIFCARRCDDDCALPSARYHRYHLFVRPWWSLPWLSFPATLLCSGSTLTLPGIAGIILASVWALTPTSSPPSVSRKSSLKTRPLPAAVKSGFKMGLTPIIDGNVTIVIVAAILMGAFGPTDGFWAKVFNPILLLVRTLHRRYCLLLRLYTAHQRAAQLRLRCLGYPRYDPRRRPLQGPAQPLVVRRQEGWHC